MYVDVHQRCQVSQLAGSEYLRGSESPGGGDVPPPAVGRFFMLGLEIAQFGAYLQYNFTYVILMY